MNKQSIKELALANGFKLKEQPDGSMDLNPYVYDFALALILQVAESAYMQAIHDFFGGNPIYVEDVSGEAKKYSEKISSEFYK